MLRYKAGQLFITRSGENYTVFFFAQNCATGIEKSSSFHVEAEEVLYSTIPLFQLSVCCEKCVADRRFSVIGKQLLISNDRNRVR
jgi:hypothetical protein